MHTLPIYLKKGIYTVSMLGVFAVVFFMPSFVYADTTQVVADLWVIHSTVMPVEGADAFCINQLGSGWGSFGVDGHWLGDDAVATYCKRLVTVDYTPGSFSSTFISDVTAIWPVSGDFSTARCVAASGPGWVKFGENELADILFCARVGIISYTPGTTPTTVTDNTGTAYTGLMSPGVQCADIFGAGWQFYGYEPDFPGSPEDPPYLLFCKDQDTLNLGVPPSFTLSVSKSGTGSGSVSSNPAGINCGSDCNEPYTSGTVVTLSASPESGSTFTGWSGSGCSGTGSCVVTMNSAQSVTATFTAAASPTADIKARDHNLINSDGPISVASGENVYITWTSTNAASCTGTGFNTGGAAQNPSVGVQVNPTIPTTYSINCGGATDSVIVNIAGGPEADIRADATNVVSGSGTTIRWCGANSHVCANTFSNGCAVGSSPGATDIQNYTAGGCSGSYATGPLSSAQTYYLSTNGPGGTNSASITVNVSSAPPPAIPGTPDLRMTGQCPNVQLTWDAVAGVDRYQLKKCDGAGCVPTPYADILPPATTYSYTTRFYQSDGPLRFAMTSIKSGLESPPSAVVENADYCLPLPVAFLQARDTAGTVIVTGTDGLGFTASGITKAGVPMTLYSYGTNAAQCAVSAYEYAQGANVRSKSVASCTGSACATGANTLYSLSGLAPNPVNGDPIDEIQAANVCVNQASEGNFKSLSVALRPGDFTLSPPTKTCTPGATAPTALSWTRSEAAIHYEVYRAEGTVVNPDMTTLVRLNDPEYLNLPLPFNQTSVTDTTALKDKKYVYGIRAYNYKGNTDSNIVEIYTLCSDAPFALAGISKDTSSARTYESAIDVKFGVATPLFFAAFRGSKSAPTDMSSDPDGWTHPTKGVSSGGSCRWNLDLSAEAPTNYNEGIITNPPAPTDCEAVRSPNSYTFNNAADTINQLFKTITYNALQIVDAPGGVSGDGQIKVRVNYQPTATLAVNKSQITPGEPITLTWESTHASLCTGNGFVTDGALNGSVTLNPGPTTDTTYSVSCSGSAVFAPAIAATNVAINSAPVAEAGISLDGITYSKKIIVQRGNPVIIWLSADKDVTTPPDGETSRDPDGWTHPTKGVSSGGKCEWNVDLNPSFAVQSTVNNPASPTACNRNNLNKTFNNTPGSYTYPVVRITDAKGALSAVDSISVEVTGSPDLIVSSGPMLASGALTAGQTVMFRGTVENQSSDAISTAFNNEFSIDTGNNGTYDVVLTPPTSASGLGAHASIDLLSAGWTNIPAGTHRVRLCADSDSQIAELNETNNCASTLITVSPSGVLTVNSCGGSPSSVRVGDAVNWSASVSGGSGSYTYAWSGDAPLAGKTSNPAMVSYDTIGTKSGSVTVTSGSETASRSCGTVSVSAGTPTFREVPPK